MNNLLINMIAILYYLYGFLSNLAWAGVTLFLMLSHEDVDLEAIQPLELSDYLTTFQRIEIIIWLINYVFWWFISNWIFILIWSPLSLYNLSMLIKRKYKENFLFISEYKHRADVEFRLIFKLVLYLIYVVLWLFMFVYKLAEYLADY